MEATITKSYMKAANLRRWLNRKDCPELIRVLKDLFNKSFKSTQKQLSVDLQGQAEQKPDTSNCAHCTFKGVNYSRAQTHLGNSLVLYYPYTSDVTPIAGSIQRIEICQGNPFFHIQRQQPLAMNKFDPFHRYPWFFAKTYSSTMMRGCQDRIPASNVVSHVARFNFRGDRAVIVNLSRVRRQFHLGIGY
jgi:hypothetical protein